MPSDDSYEITGERLLTDKITAIKNLAKSYEMRMRGFKPAGGNDRWEIVGKALAGSNFISQSTGVIMSFAESANLLTTKTPEKFLMEFQDAFYRTNVAMLNDEAIPSANYRSIIKMFKDTMSNIGDIITGSKDTLKSIFAKEELYQGGTEQVYG